MIWEPVETNFSPCFSAKRLRQRRQYQYQRRLSSVLTLAEASGKALNLLVSCSNVGATI